MKSCSLKEKRNKIDTSKIQVYPGKTLAGLLKNIYDNSVEKSKRIEGLVDQLADLIEKPEHATAIVPLIKEYLDIDIKNDQKLVEVAKVVQRLESAAIRSSEQGAASGSGQLSENEKNQLREIAKELREGKEQEIEDDLKQLENKKETALDKINQENK